MEVVLLRKALRERQPRARPSSPISVISLHAPGGCGVLSACVGRHAFQALTGARRW